MPCEGGRRRSKPATPARGSLPSKVARRGSVSRSPDPSFSRRCVWVLPPPAALWFSSMVDLFSGRFLVNLEGDSVDPEQALENKIVGLYFSAAWCSLCREFTPVLYDFYRELVEDAPYPAPFQIVFISSDRSYEEMASYMQYMHPDWLALTFQDPFKQELKKKYNITAIPKLVIVKQTGDVVTDKGRKQICERGLKCFQNWLEGADVFQNFCS